METNYKCPTWEERLAEVEERLAEVRKAKRKLLRGDPSDAIQIIIRRNPYWDADYIDEEWFLEELKEEEQFILDEPKRAKELEEEMKNGKWRKFHTKNKDNSPFATFR